MMAVTSGRGGFLPAAPPPAPPAAPAALVAALAFALSFFTMESSTACRSSLQKKYPAFQYVLFCVAAHGSLYLPVMNLPYELALTPMTFWNEEAVTLYVSMNLRILVRSA